VAEEQSVSLIESLRKRIDELDEQLVRLLSARAACALEVGRAKKAAGVEIYQPTREAEVLAHVAHVNRGPLDNGAIRRLFERIIDEARRLERVADGNEDPHGGSGEGAPDPDVTSY
jgi:chorismate mutase